MFLKFNIEKAIQAAGVLMREEGKTMTRLRLLKLLLIADRQNLRDTGRPILGSRIVAMDNGPLHSDVYDLIKGTHNSEPAWSAYFTNDGPRNLRMTEQSGVGLLSRQEIDTLIRVSQMHETTDDYALSQLTHEFPEWQETYEKGTSRPISLEKLIAGVGREDDKEAILQDLHDDEAFNAFFSRREQ